jgi:hypothetical protein
MQRCWVTHVPPEATTAERLAAWSAARAGLLEVPGSPKAAARRARQEAAAALTADPEGRQAPAKGSTKEAVQLGAAGASVKIEAGAGTALTPPHQQQQQQLVATQQVQAAGAQAPLPAFY